MFAISIVLWALDMADFIMEIKLSFVVDPDLPLSARLGNARLFIFPNIAAIDALYAYMVSFPSGVILSANPTRYFTVPHR
jgi:hypothetical protein